MEDMYTFIALVSAGTALIAGLISLMVGTNPDGERVERIFGIQAICFFIFLVLPPTGYIIDDKPPYPAAIEIKRVFSWAHYMLMPVFFEAYTGFRKRYFTPLILVSSVVVYILMVTASAGMIVPAWRIMVYVPLSLIPIYGILLVRKQFREGARTDAAWLVVA